MDHELHETHNVSLHAISILTQEAVEQQPQLQVDTSQPQAEPADGKLAFAVRLFAVHLHLLLTCLYGDSTCQ